MMDGESLRSEEDVVATLTLSKLDPSDLAMPSQTLFFSETASDQKHILIQLNKDILQSVEQGEEIVIRGNQDDSAIICTSDKTYDIKRAKISNTMLLLPECQVLTKNKSKLASSDEEKENVNNSFQLIHQKIEGWSHDYFELKRSHPKITKLKVLLSENPYEGPEKEEEKSHQNKYTMSDFLNSVQASEGELVTSLLNLGACCIDGYWRILDFGYTVESLGEICNVINCESWNVKHVPLRKLCEKVNDSGELVPDFVVQHLLSFYGHKVPTDREDVIFKLDEEKLCRFFAKMLLLNAGKFNLQEFLEVWQQTVPNNITTDEKYLCGLAIIDKSANPPTIQLFPADSLSQIPSERFESLFEIRPKWTREEIQPYIDDLCLEGQSVSALLTKYCRSSIADGVKLFCSRKSLR